jgi:hypothetical protein
MLPCILRPPDQPIRAKESMSVLRLMPKVRQTAALVAPPSSATTTAASFSPSIATGRPPRRPRRRAAARPARTRSWIRDRSNCARAPKTWNRNSPCGVVVSICSVSDRNATSRSWRAVYCREQVGKRSAETVKLPYHKAVVRSEERQSLCQAGAPPGCRWHDLQTSAADRPQRPTARRAANPAPADRHRSRHACSRPACVRKSPVEPFPYSTPFRQCLSCMFCAQTSPRTRSSAARRESHVSRQRPRHPVSWQYLEALGLPSRPSLVFLLWPLMRIRGAFR